MSPASATAADVTFFSLSRSCTNSSWLLATGDGRNVDIWLIDIADALTDAQVIDLHSGSTVHISPDSKLIAAMDYWNFGINIIDTDSGEVVRTIKREKSNQSRLAFSPDSYFCAGQAVDTDDIHIWDINTGTVIRELKGLGYSRTAMVFSSDAKYLVTGYDKAGNCVDCPEGLVRIWHVETGQNLYEFSFKPSGYGIGAMAISADLNFVAICDSGRKMQIWEPLAGRCVYKIEQWGASNLRFSSDSKFLAAMNLIQDEVQIWEIATGACLFCVRSGDPMAFFDPANGDILTDQFIYKNSSWKHWQKLPRQGYSLKCTLNETWIYLDGQKTLPIPYELRPPINRCSVLSNSSLMAFTSMTNQVIMIKFPDSHGIKGQEATMLGANSDSHPHLNLDRTSNLDASYLTDEDFGPSAKKKTRLG